ncbi:MAG: flagellar hook assembly protein FlgD [Alphaproteobacteria bacterium]|nr:flagellar hook assembly protein FlgD [Alphaproteobacteria bacterium]
MSTVSPVSNQQVLDNYLAQQASLQPKKETESTSDLGQLLNDQSTFLKLLTTQMQNQDPLAPTDPNEYTKQLTEFAAVEQAIKHNDKLDQLIALQGSSGLNNYIGYLDRFAEISSTGALPLQGGAAQVGYKLTDVAGEVDVIVKNASGTEVARLDGPTSVGNHFVTWNGKTSDGTQLPDDLYKFEIVAKKSDGTNLAPSNTTVIGKISTVATGPDGVLLSLGSMVIGDDEILSVTTERPKT